MESFDPIQLQRLIDGELDFESTQAMLREAETSPRLWRTIATHFVEDQAFRKGFSIPTGSTVATRDGVSSETAAGATAGYRFLALAASMLIAIGLGFLAGQNFDTASTDGPSSTLAAYPDEGALVADNTPSLDSLSNDGNQIANNQLVSYRPDYHLQLQDPNGNPVMDSEVPLYRPETARRLGVLENQALPPEFVQQVFDRGYGVNQNVNYIAGQLNDGRRFVVPVQTIDFAPGQ